MLAVSHLKMKVTGRNARGHCKGTVFGVFNPLSKGVHALGLSCALATAPGTLGICATLGLRGSLAFTHLASREKVFARWMDRNTRQAFPAHGRYNGHKRTERGANAEGAGKVHRGTFGSHLDVYVGDASLWLSKLPRCSPGLPVTSYPSPDSGRLLGSHSLAFLNTRSLHHPLYTALPYDLH